MSSVWPPPPEYQPQIAAYPPSLRHRLASVISSGLLYSCLGAVLLVTPVMLVLGSWGYTRLRFLSDADLFFGSVSLLGLILVVVGGSLGYAARDRASGLAAVIVSSAALCFLFGLVVVRHL